MKNKYIKILLSIGLIFTLIGCGQKEDFKSIGENKDSFEVVDILERKIVLDKPVERVVAIGSALRLYTYINKTELLVGVEKTQQDQKTGRPYVLANPQLSDLALVGEGHPAPVDPELIILANPDVIIAGDIFDLNQIADLEKKTGIPVIVVATDAANIFSETVYKSLSIIGEVVNKEDRAQEVIDYMEASKAEIENLVLNIPEDKKPTIYLGGLSYNGNHGIESTSGDSVTLNILKAKNVAQGVGESHAVIIDKEKLLEWDPEMIVIDESGLSLVLEDFSKNPAYYKSLSAVKNNQVYAQLPNVNYYVNYESALADIYYLGTLMYPEEFGHIDSKVKADEIYEFLLRAKLYERVSEMFGGFIEVDLN